MNLAGVVAMFFVLFVALVAPNEIKRYKEARLMAFPRVGRSDPALWVQDISDDKRSHWNKMVFPMRTGRVDPNEWELENREVYKRSENKPGLWFGPRMGRVAKRNTPEEDVMPWATIVVNGLPIPSRFIYNSNIDDQSSDLTDQQKEDSTIQ